MPKYYKVADGKRTLYVTVDDGGSVIIKDEVGRKVFLSKYQAKLMKTGFDTFLKEMFKDADSKNVIVEEITGQK